MSNRLILFVIAVLFIAPLPLFASAAVYLAINQMAGYGWFILASFIWAVIVTSTNVKVTNYPKGPSND